jgi:hypothetical protein
LGWGSVLTGLRSAVFMCIVCLITSQANAWGLVQFHGSRNCSSDSVSVARLCTANKCCISIMYNPADRSQSAIGAIGYCKHGRVLGKLYSAYGEADPFSSLVSVLTLFLADCSGQVLSTFDVEELESDDIQSSRCSLVGSEHSGMGDCSGGASLQVFWRYVASVLILCLVLN